jgi:hypothetical protein
MLYFTPMKTKTQKRIKALKDEYWTEHRQLFTAQFPSYYTKPQTVLGRFHTGEEDYFGAASEIMPLKHKKGRCTYVMMQPYVLEPILTLTVGLYQTPKHYADQDTAIGKTIGQPKQERFREVQVGNAQAWYYPGDKMIVLWECFLDDSFRKHPLAEDPNMQNLWKGFEHWLVKQFPEATTIATPFHDPIAETIGEYQAFLKELGFSPLANAAFGKQIQAK